MRDPRMCLASLALLAAAGCIERRETLTVDPDGSVLIELTFNAASHGELYEGDAIPSPDGPWLVEEWTEADAEGRPRYRLVAEGVFGPQDPLPENLAPPDDPWPETFLQFPTTLTIEPRFDGIYYHLCRKYPKRPWAQVEALRKLLLDEPLKAVEGKKAQDMTADDRVLIVRAFVGFEVAKILAFAREAFLEVSPEAPQDRWLAVAARVRALEGHLNVARITEFMTLDDDTERDEALAEEVRRFEAEATAAIDAGLREDAGYGGSRMLSFQRRFDSLKRSHEITAELADDAFEVTVVMPGEIVGTNADVVAGSSVTWRFGGERFRDRSMELLVSSRIPIDP